MSGARLTIAALLVAPLLFVAASTLTARAAVVRVGVDAATVQAAVDRAAEGDTVEVPAGVWTGAVKVGKRLTLRGEGVLDGGGEGMTLTIDAPGVVVEGLTIRHSGTDLRGPDSCIYVSKLATGCVIQRNHLSACGFGIWTHEVEGAKLLDNTIVGDEVVHRSNRGNGINLFDSKALVVARNVITGGRDGIYVSATEDSLIEGNHMERTRYGIHYMYSWDNTVRGNISIHNGSGYALMGSQRLLVTHNVAAYNDDHGLLFRDIQKCEIRENRLEHNGEGMFFYSSTENLIADNRVADNEVGAKIWAGSKRNRVTGNAFVGNRRQIFYVSTEDLEWGVEQPGNRWGDYLGWDQDGDGIGDRPYRVDSFTTNLLHRYPSAVLLIRSPALELLTHMEGRMPLLRVPTVIDRRPQLRGAGG